MHPSENRQPEISRTAFDGMEATAYQALQPATRSCNGTETKTVQVAKKLFSTPFQTAIQIIIPPHTISTTAPAEHSSAITSEPIIRSMQGDLTKKTAMDLAVENVWIEDHQAYLSDDPMQLREEVKLRRTEIFSAKNLFTAKKKRALELKDKIKRIQSPQIEKEFLLHASYLPNESLHTSVNELLFRNKGYLEPCQKGKGGVYFLRSSDHQIKYIIKPFDEDMLTLNNPKGYALPLRSDEIGRPKPGVSAYMGAENEILAGKIAELLGISRCTAKSDVMILTSDVFHDFTDRISVSSDSERQELYRHYGRPDKEKLCVVQEFIPDHQEIADFLLKGNQVSKAEYEVMGDWEKAQLEKKKIPANINQQMYEEAIVLATICGETDANLGNFLISNEPDKQTNLRTFVKIDNAACFSDDNRYVNSGVDVLLNCREKDISETTKSLIRELNSESIAELMQNRGFSKKNIDKMKTRIEILQHVEYRSEPDDIKSLFEFIAFVEYFMENDD